MAKSKIEWTEHTWNPTTGCTKVSPGCAYCYAETRALHLQAMGSPAYANGFQFTTHPNRLAIPLRRQTPTLYFVDSMSDLFHEAMPDGFRRAVFGVMALTPRHAYKILTKRADVMRKWFTDLGEHPYLFQLYGTPALNHISRMYPDGYPVHPWPLDNVEIGVSVENRKHGIPRIDMLRHTPADLRFLSIEPLLEDLGPLDLTGIHQVIVGQESGAGTQTRPMELDWARNIRDQCQAQGVAFFMKQITRNGRKIPYAEFPDDLKIREPPPTAP